MCETFCVFTVWCVYGAVFKSGVMSGVVGQTEQTVCDLCYVMLDTVEQQIQECIKDVKQTG